VCVCVSLTFQNQFSINTRKEGFAKVSKNLARYRK